MGGALMLRHFHPQQINRLAIFQMLMVLGLIGGRSDNALSPAGPEAKHEPEPVTIQLHRVRVKPALVTQWNIESVNCLHVKQSSSTGSGSNLPW